MKTDEEQIRELVATWMTATKAGDVDTVLNLIADDVVFLVPGRPPMFKSEFSSAMKAQAGPGAPKFDGNSEIQEIKVLGDWAFMWTKLSVIATPPDGSPKMERAGHTLSGIFLSDDLTTQVGTFALLPQITRAVNVPVIAAGGIADARGVTAAMALGAAGVQIGTAYLLCPEATTSAIHRAALKSDAARHTALTNLFTGRPARGIVNRIMRELGPLSAAAPAFPLATSGIAPVRAKAESRGSGDFSPLWSGQNASGCREISAADLTRELAKGL